MRKINLATISALDVAPTNLYLQKGHLIYTKGDIIPSNCAEILERSGILYLCQVPDDELGNFSFLSEYKSIDLGKNQMFQEEGKLQRSLYDQKGNLVLGAGSMLTSRIVENLKRNNNTVLYLRRSKSAIDKDESAANELKRRLQDVDPKKFNSDIVNSLNLDFQEVNRNFFQADFVDDLEAKFKDSFKPDVENSLIGKISHINPSAVRSDLAKKNMNDFFDTSFASLKAILYGITLKKITDSSGLIEIAQKIVSVLVQDKELMMNTVFLHEEYDNDFVISHSVKATIVSVNIALAMGYSTQQVFELALGCLLHDIGMLRVPQEILYKKSNLTESEKVEVFKHSVYALDVLERLRNLPVTTPLLAYHCHERGDRSGYPKGRSMNTITLFARIVSIADIYCAMISKRSYRDAYTPYSVVEYLTREAVSGRIDSTIFKQFLRINSLYPIGSWVSLSDGRVGKVIAADPEQYDRPVIRIFYIDNKRVKNGEAVKLADELGIKVSKAFSGAKLKIDVMEGF